MDILKARDVAKAIEWRITYPEKRQYAVNDMLEMRVGIALTSRIGNQYKRAMKCNIRWLNACKKKKPKKPNIRARSPTAGWN